MYDSESDYFIVKDATAAAKGDDKPKGDPFKFEKIAKEFIDGLLTEGKYPLAHNGRFYLYDGTRYVPETELAGRVRTFLRQHKRPQSNNVIGNVVPVVENYAQKFITEHPELPFYGGGDQGFPAPGNVLAFRNGLLDVAKHLDGGDTNLTPHTPLWCSPFALPYPFDPAATCPTWLQFLNEVFDGDADRVALLQEWFGYCLLSDTRYQKFLWMPGPPGAGKGTVAGVLRATVGGDYFTGYSLFRLADSHGLEALIGKTVAVVGEADLGNTPDKGRILETFKRITGNDPVDVNPKHKAGYSTTLPTRFLILSNENLSFVDPTGAVARRTLALPFTRSFSHKADDTLPDRLAAEVAGVCNWALAGLKRLRATGRFTESEAGREKVRAARRETNVFAFVQDRLVVRRDLDPGNLDGVAMTDDPVTATADGVRDAYLNWCEEHDIPDHYRHPHKLRTNLRAILPKLAEPKRERHGAGRAYLYSGIGVKDNDAVKDKGAPPPERRPNAVAFRWIGGQQFQVRGLPDDVTGTPITEFEDGSVRVRFTMSAARHAALPDNQRERLRLSATGAYILDVPPADLTRAT